MFWVSFIAFLAVRCQFDRLADATNRLGQMLLTNLHFLQGSGDETNLPKPGQKLLTSGAGKVFPRDLVAGVIESTTSEKGMVCRPLADIRSVQSVIILTSDYLQEEMLSLLTDE